MQPQKRHNLRYKMTLSLALAGLTTAGGVLLYRAEKARAQDEPVELPQPIDQNTPEEPLPPFIPQPDPRDLVPVQPAPQPQQPDIDLPGPVLPPDVDVEQPPGQSGQPGPGGSGQPGGMGPRPAMPPSRLNPIPPGGMRRHSLSRPSRQATQVPHPTIP